ncbi:hypothetical protein [Bacillus songklensis]|uniref:hypothetical protein n=1 Tax=Bacillus songklensis TaxID=1069116 RepID=UPI00366EEF82
MGAWIWILVGIALLLAIGYMVDRRNKQRNPAKTQTPKQISESVEQAKEKVHQLDVK